jgi:hypothetical protein
MQRRTLLKLGFASGAALTLLAGTAVLLYEPAWRDGRLSETGRRVLRGVARAILDGWLPDDATNMQVALRSHLDRMDDTLRAMPPAAQREIAQLLALLASTPGRLALAGLGADWSDADVPRVQAALQGMRSSRIGLRMQAYHALRDLTHAAYFSDRTTWARLGYPGPSVIE